MVERRRRQVHRLGVGAEHAGDQQVDGVRCPEGDIALGDLHALGSSGRAGRVEHVGTLDGVDELVAALGGDGGHELGVAGGRSVDDEAVLDAGSGCRDLGGELSLGRRGDEHACAAVVDDVRHLLAGESRGDRGVVQPGVVRAPRHRQEPGVVLHAECDVVTRGESEFGEEVGDALRPVVQLGVGHDLAGRRHHVGRLVGVRRGVGTGVQGIVGHAARPYSPHSAPSPGSSPGSRTRSSPAPGTARRG